MNRINRGIIRLLSKSLAFILHMFKCDLEFIDYFVEYYTERSSNYLRYKLYPKHTSSYSPLTIETDMNNGEIAIVLQGMLELKDNFTVETVKLYRKLYPMASVIISTWQGVDEKTLKELKALNCDVILNKNFSPSGFCNVNYQLCTSLAGIRHAKEKGAKYVLKSRSDLRIYREYSLDYLKSLLSQFPIRNEFHIPLKSRIIALEGSKGSRFFPYWMQDYVYFGQTEDLENFLDIEYDMRTKADCIQLQNSKDRISYHNGKEYCDTMPPEIYITSSFFMKYMDVHYTVDEWWKLLKDYFVVIGIEDLDIIWPKYDIFRSISNFSNIYDGKIVAKEEARNIPFTFFLPLYEGHIIYDERSEKMRVKLPKVKM